MRKELNLWAFLKIPAICFPQGRIGSSAIETGIGRWPKAGKAISTTERHVCYEQAKVNRARADNARAAGATFRNGRAK